MSHVTVSGAWVEKGKSVTCYGFWGLEGDGERCHMLRLLWFGGKKRKRCHMLRFLGFGDTREKVSHVTVSGAWQGKRKGVTCYGF